MEDVGQLEEELEWMRFRLGNTADVGALIELQQDIEIVKQKIKVIKEKQIQSI